MNRLLTNVNKLLVVAKHVSAKFNLNQQADVQSRLTPPCKVESCSIHRFIDEMTDTVLDPAARCSAFDVDTSFSNRQAWRQAQQNSDACKAAVAYLKSGKVPHSKPGEMNNEIRHYVRHAMLAPDGLLITTGDAQSFDITGQRNKIIAPHNVAPGLLYHMHNQSLGSHPSVTQLKARFNRNFYTWNLQPLLEVLYKKCYVCSVIQKQPPLPAVHESKVEVSHPHRYFHADIIRRAGQCIMLVIFEILQITSKRDLRLAPL